MICGDVCATLWLATSRPVLSDANCEFYIPSEHMSLPVFGMRVKDALRLSKHVGEGSWVTV
jgi:hypothetical protein